MEYDADKPVARSETSSVGDWMQESHTLFWMINSYITLVNRLWEDMEVLNRQAAARLHYQFNQRCAEIKWKSSDQVQS